MLAGKLASAMAASVEAQEASRGTRDALAEQTV